MCVKVFAVQKNNTNMVFFWCFFGIKEKKHIVNKNKIELNTIKITRGRLSK